MADSSGNGKKPLFKDPFEDFDETLDLGVTEDSPKSNVGMTESALDEVLVDEDAIAEGSKDQPPQVDPIQPGDSGELELEREGNHEETPIDQGSDLLLESLIASIDRDVSEAFGEGMTYERSLTAEVPEGEQGQFIAFYLAGTEYAVDIDNVTEIGEPPDITPVPNVPEWILGATNLRGEIISMVDLCAFLGIEPSTSNNEQRMMVVQTRDQDFRTGLVVDRVSGIRYLSRDQINLPGANIEDQVTPYLVGVTGDEDSLLAVLDFDRMLHAQIMHQT